MAKTIKELAIEAYPMRELIAYGNIVDALQFQRLAFMEGANAVLDEIIACFSDTPFCNPNEVIDIITSRIKELKGD